MAGFLEGTFIEGTFIVRCQNGHDDQVDSVTHNHDCDECGAKAVDADVPNSSARRGLR